MKAIHLSQARVILERGAPVSLSIVRKNGSILRAEDVVSLRFDIYRGTRQIKYIRSGQIRTIHDVCIIAIDDFEVFI